MSECVPYFVKDDPAIVNARVEQHRMVLHILMPEKMAEYYGANPHERPFEEQYGIGVDECHRIPRVGWLLECLNPPCRVLDLSANDGWMVARLKQEGYDAQGLDLNPSNVARARERGVDVSVGDLMDAPFGLCPHAAYDAVVLFETLEHVADPEGALMAMSDLAKSGGWIYVSTPNGAVEYGNVPEWNLVEYKGHVRAIVESDLRQMLESVGHRVSIELGADNTLLGRAQILR